MLVNELEVVWHNIIVEARLLLHSDSVLNRYIYENLLQHEDFKHALMYIMSKKLSNSDMSKDDIMSILTHIYHDNHAVIAAARDIRSIRINDPSVTKYSTPFLYLKGFHALQIHRVCHWLWHHNYQELAMYFYHHMSISLNIDIHPSAKIGNGVMLDHATGLVIGETSIVEDDVSIMQSVTLGSTGKSISGDRHPKIRRGVMIGAGAIILGNIEVGYNSKVGAGSVVLHSVPPCVTVAGNPARLVVTNKQSL